MSTPANFNPSQRPGMVSAIAIMTLVSGIVNLFWGIVAFGTAVASLGLALICLGPLLGLAILPSILGIFEILFAAKLLSTPPQRVQPSTSIAVMEICTILVGNVFTMVAGILTLVFYNDPQVKDYFNRLNEMPAPANDAGTPGTEPAPKEESPAKPKPRRRKITKEEDLSDK